MSNCKKCGANDWEVRSQLGALETIQCRKCGTEELVHTYYVNQSPNVASDEPWLMLSIVLPKSITSEEIKGLQNIFRRIELMSPIAVKKAAVAQEVIELGKYPLSEAELFSQQADKLGIGISLAKIPV
jgi:hypothetical protein